MAQVKDKEILGEYVDRGYYLVEHDDDVVTVHFKDEERALAVFPQTAKTTTPIVLKAVCRRHWERLATPAGVPQ